MGGGGFMQHASDTNRKDRAQKAARREKFKGNHSDKGIVGSEHTKKIDFSHLTESQILEERIRIKKTFIKQRKKAILTYSLAISILFLILLLIYTSIVR